MLKNDFFRNFNDICKKIFTVTHEEGIIIFGDRIPGGTPECPEAIEHQSSIGTFNRTTYRFCGLPILAYRKDKKSTTQPE